MNLNVSRQINVIISHPVSITCPSPAPQSKSSTYHQLFHSAHDQLNWQLNYFLLSFHER